MRRLFGERDFVAYFVARQSSVLAFSIETVAIGWQIFALRHRPFDLGLVGLTLFVPQLVLAIPAGLLADRVDRRLVCLFTTIAEVLALGLFIALTLAGSHSVSAYFAAVAIIGIAHALGDPATRTLLVNVVETHHYARATAFSQSVAQLLGIAGPALGGALIAIATPIAFAGAAACYAVAAAGFAFLPKLQADGHAEESLARAASMGIHFIFSKKIVLGAISLDLFAVLFGGATALLPVYAVSILHVGPVGFGALRAAPGVGAALVAAFLSRKPIERNTGPVLLWCVAGFGLATIVFGVSKIFAVSLVALALTGGFDMVSMVIRSVLVQLGTPDAMRGRVNAVENVFIGASNELGAFESGTVAALLGTEASVVLGGVATIVVILLCSWLFPDLRRYDRPVAAQAPAIE
ncbi:MAG TPA: MFS transporter [Candidatus Acidoferrales bacterium]|nr:MFS transporter [Candidatus Acidoferrales bacterium]